MDGWNESRSGYSNPDKIENNNYNQDQHHQSASRRYRQSDPVNGRDNASFVSSQNQLHQPLSKSNSDSTNFSTIDDRDRWKVAGEQLGLRRRLPRADLELLVDVLGHERLRRMRSKQFADYYRKSV